MKTWTKPYYGVTHCGALGDRRSATVSDYGSFAVLSEIWHGCGFSPNQRQFDTVEEAKEAGELWIDNGAAIGHDS